MSNQKQNNEISKSIPVDLIDDPVIAVRSHLDADSIHELAQSIRFIGLIQPLVVRPVGDRYEVVAGHRRLAAVRYLQQAAVQCVVRDLDETATTVTKIHENLYRKEVNPVEEAVLYHRRITESNINAKEFASTIDRSESYVRDRLAIIDYPDYLIAALEMGKMNLSCAKYLGRITDDKICKHYVEYALRSGINTHVARMWYEAWKVGTLPPQPTETSVVDYDTGKETTRSTVPCFLCLDEIPNLAARLVYIHPECQDKLETQYPPKQE